MRLCSSLRRLSSQSSRVTPLEDGNLRSASWKLSKHAENGIGCYECHQAAPEDADAIDHYSGKPIATIVSPKDCGTCHATAMDEFIGSHHAKAGEILDSLDNYMGEVIEGFPASVSGCQQCHGSKVIVDEEGVLDAKTWPNFGIGRINPDGTSGACSACHTRHEFSVAQARAPENCGKGGNRILPQIAFPLSHSGNAV